LQCLASISIAAGMQQLTDGHLSHYYDAWNITFVYVSFAITVSNRIAPRSH